MEKALNLCKEIRTDFSKDWTEELTDYNLLPIFQSVLNLNETIDNRNRIICFIVYAYSPQSKWLDLEKDRTENKVKIFQSLGADPKKEPFKSIIDTSNDIVGISLFNYLEELKDWRWRSVFDLLEYASKMSRFASRNTEEERKWDEVDSKSGDTKKLSAEVDIAVVVRVNKEKGNLLEEAFNKRKKADELISQIKKDFVLTDNATQQDLGFQFSETSRKRNIMSWREFIRDREERKLTQQGELLDS